ncbi:MAG: sulfatase-like hydrolase/transferase, partial [Planctomycetota bacterium]
LTDVFSNEAVSFIERHSKERFLLYLSYNAVHTPLQVPEKYLDGVPKNLNEKRRKMIGMNKAMDVGIGKVLQALRENGLEENTLVIFFNDNGGAVWVGGTSNAPLSGGKGGLKEGGVRVPFILRWPGKFAANKIYDKPIISLDIFPTIVATAQQQLPEDRKIDGVNLLPYLTGSKKDSPHKYLFFRHTQDYAVRKGRFKLHIDRKDKKPKLYDLQKDIAEKNDLSDKLPEVVEEFKEALKQWESQMTPPQAEKRILKSRLMYRTKKEN